MRLSIVCISTILIIITSIINPKAFDRIFVQVLNTMKIQEFIKNDNRELDQIVIFTQQHTDHYNSAYKMIKHNFLFGLGVKNFRNFAKMKSTLFRKFLAQLIHIILIFKYLQKQVL